ncbi:MAG TPA: carboxymuconolactone decarboxylase family protein [Terriglobales bacterium]|nr:carboxymuconolactone decarboxylase family protein [Terriglobales bacterium]
MRIELVDRESAAPEVRRIFDALEKEQGSVSNLNRTLARRPAVLRAYNQLYGALWAESALPGPLKEMAFLRTAILAGCEY